MDKIKTLAKALEDIGVDVEIWWDAEWYCVDNKVHCGIELITDIDNGEDCLSFCFTPKGEYIDKCLKAPLKK